MKMREWKIIITITIAIIGIMLSVQSFPISKYPMYQYQINQDTDYKVYIEPNDFIQKKYLGKNQVYVQSLIKYIELNFSYYYQASQKENVKNNYNIVATLIISYSNTNQKIVEKEYPIIINKTLDKLDTSNMEINEIINIDYQQYYQEVQKFKQQFNLPVKAVLKINFNVNTEINSEKRTDKASMSEISIDLSEPVFEIKTQESEDQKETVLENAGANINYVLLTIGVLLFIISNISLLYQIRKYQLIQTTRFKLKIKEILRKYSDIIVELDKEPIINIKNFIDVKDFNELIDIEEEIREPILYYEKDKESIFIIINKEIVYRKILRDDNNK